MEPVHVVHSKEMELAELIRDRQPCVVLTGAGISTESGIPDFRSPTGVWAQYDPMEYATISAFRRDPVKVWEFYALRFEVLVRAEPNAGPRSHARPASCSSSGRRSRSIRWPRCRRTRLRRAESSRS